MPFVRAVEPEPEFDIRSLPVKKGIEKRIQLAEDGKIATKREDKEGEVATKGEVKEEAKADLLAAKGEVKQEAKVGE